MSNPKKELQKKSLSVHSLKKSIGAVHSIPHNPLTLVQRKLINVCIYHAYDKLKTDTEHKISIDLLHIYFGYKGNNWQLFNEAFEALQKTIFTWNVFGESTGTENTSWERVPLISKVAWDSNARNFIFKFGEGLIDKFYIPDRYVMLTLEMQSKFTTPSALVLYEQCARYATNKNGTRWFWIDEIKNILSIGNKYQQFKDLNSWVLKPAIKEINNLTDILIEPEFKKEKRKVTQIKFTIKIKNEINAENTSDSTVNEKKIHIKDILVNTYGVASKVADSMLKDYGVDRITESINYVKSTANYRKNKVPNLAGYIVKAVKENYRSGQQIKECEVKLKDEVKYNHKEIMNFGEKIKLEYAQYKRSYIDKYITKNKLLKDDELLKKFQNDHDGLIKTYTALMPKKKYLNIEPIKSAFRKYILENFNCVVMKLDEYISNLPDDSKNIWQKYVLLSSETKKSDQDSLNTIIS